MSFDVVVLRLGEVLQGHVVALLSVCVVDPEFAADVLADYVEVLLSFGKEDGFLAELLVHGRDEQVFDLGETGERRVVLDEVRGVLAEEAVWAGVAAFGLGLDPEDVAAKTEFAAELDVFEAGIVL